MDTIKQVKKPSPKKVIEIDGQTINGISFRDPDNKIGVVISKKDMDRINEGASCHRLNGKLFEVSELRYIRDQVMILGKPTENPTPYFAMQEWGL